MQIARIEKSTSVEGPGKRAVFWVQGCSIRCPSCCNPEMQPFGRGIEISPSDLASEIASAGAEGLTILGGEPLDQSSELFVMLSELRKLVGREYGIILFSGYTYEQICASEEKQKAVQMCDILIAGPFDKSYFPDNRRWIGSSNQTIHFITDLYSDLKADWPPLVKEIELVFKDNAIMVNGTPLDESDPLSELLTSILPAARSKDEKNNN